MDGQHWYDLFGRRSSRRDFLRAGAGAAALVALGGLPGCSAGRRLKSVQRPFRLGVASGDPTHDGVVVWTRLDRSALEAQGAHRDPVAVRWEVAADEAFRQVVRSGTADARPELGHSVHVELEGLGPGRDYFYRFDVGGEASPVGRTKTAPSMDAPTNRFDFAFVSCQHYEHGYFTALRHLSAETLDAVVHLGDYIYEGARNPNGIRHHEGPEIVDLDGYRARYATYRSDVDLQAAHAAAPWLVTFDDHEVDNDWAGDVPEDDQSPEAFLLRRAAAFQAYYEFMPLRRSSMPTGPAMQIYRRVPFGDLVEMSLLDTRQYRSDQPCGRNVAPSCAEHVGAGRTLLGDRQKGWLFDGLARSEARWNVLAQQVLMARFRNVRDGAETWSMDKWDGYPVERTEVLGALADSDAANPVVLTGDIHSSWVTRLLRDFEDERSEVVATELVCTSLTSGGDGQAMTSWGEAALRHNAHVDFYDARRGYVHCAVERERMTARYRMVPIVQSPNSSVETLATFVVEDGRPGAERSG
ncbi:MAG: alkaline phosphatase [Gemmatimonadetes bacterium]|nr:alkaline phosphatase D family protein [Gemmatimonadota bacterium]NNF14764.1 alkaline phosphatase [Gemmatimonadota bacterium]NNL31278.1 alkaline phosphatase [Gemmatimonadota bacterium]